MRFENQSRLSHAPSACRNRRFWGNSPGAVVALALLSATALAQTPTEGGSPAGEAVTLPPIEVVGTTPLPGTGIDVDKVPSNVQTLSSANLAREGSASLPNVLADRMSSVNINGTLDDPFQPDILYRGFEASPLLGTPQGLAVFQNGVRINEAFGDNVNWDFLVDSAINRIDVLSSNPVFGLNALGGALVVTMKNGFTYHGFEGELGGGSFGQRGGSLQFGQQFGALGIYIAGKIFDEDGWRKFSSDAVSQLYADIGARSGRGLLDISFSGASNRLFGQGPSPVQELAVGRSLVFTGPQENVNRLDFLTMNGSIQMTDNLLLEGNTYRREFRQAVSNGNTTTYTACTTGNGLLCQLDGRTPVTGTNGALLPDLSSAGTTPIGENDLESIHSVGIGGTLQVAHRGFLFGHENNLVLGASIDRSITDFQTMTEVGVFNASLFVLPGFFVATPEGTGFNATPIELGARNDYYGIFGSDTFNLTPALAMSASGRYNIAQIDLADREGSSLSGRNRFSRLNPAVGVSYRVSPEWTAYAGYSEGNRVPTPSEIECSNPAQPCLLPSSLVSDPPRLKQVVSHTYEAGLRGKLTWPRRTSGNVGWNLGLFRTNLDNDIYGVASSLSTGYFQNVGSTRRQGIEAGLNYKDRTLALYAAYSFVDATFQSPFKLRSPNNPMADAQGDIQVVSGDRLPGIPEHRIKLGVDYNLLKNLTVGTTITYVGNQVFRGDESNQNPTLPGYMLMNLHGSFMLNKKFEIFANIQDVLNVHYETFGTFGDPTSIGTPGVPSGAVSNGPNVDHRFVSPGAPIAIFGGIRMRL